MTTPATTPVEPPAEPELPPFAKFHCDELSCTIGREGLSWFLNNTVDREAKLEKRAATAEDHLVYVSAENERLNANLDKTTHGTAVWGIAGVIFGAALGAILVGVAAAATKPPKQLCQQAACAQ